MARNSGKLKVLRRDIKSVAPDSKPFGPIGPKIQKDRDPMILSENTQKGVKARTQINVPGVKTR